VVHNLSVDDHSLYNHGIVLGGAVNSLALSRWVWPHRARGSGYSLDTLGLDLLGIGKTEGFQDIFSEEVTEVVRVKQREVKSCACSLPGCRKRKLPEHEKTASLVQESVSKTFVRPLPLESVLPGHSRWERAVAYSARDAVLALGVWDKVQREMGCDVPVPWSSMPQREVPVPWFTMT